MKKIAHIYVDEYGDPNLDISKKGTTPYFIYTAVVVFERNLREARDVHSSIIRKFFNQQGIIKSNRIPNDDRGYNLQVNILNELKSLNHYVVCIVVDKKEIDRRAGGLLYKPSFVKFFQRLLAEELLNKYDEYHICVDKLGRPRFRDEVKRYMSSKLGLETTLFNYNSFEFKDDVAEEPLIQIADFYSGCIGRQLCGKFNTTQGNNIHNIIKSYVFVKWFPSVGINYLGARYIKSDQFCEEIYSIGVITAERYLESNEGDDIAREIVMLLLHESFANPFRHISSKEIKQKIEFKGLSIGDPITEVSKLRDKGVFIISPSGKKGYKFPCNEKEIAEYFDRISLNVVPQLKRAHKLHRILIEQSTANHNLLSTEEFSVLNDLIGIVNK